MFRYRYRTVQVHNLPDFLVFAALPAKLMGAAVVLDLHDLMPELFAGRFDTDLRDKKVRLIGAQERWSARFADFVITVTHDWRQTLIDRGVPAEKVGVVMNLADGRLFRRRPAIPHSGIRLVYHGTFTHRYGVDVAIEAIALARHDVPDIHLSLLGAGETRDELMDLRRHLGLEACVEVSDGMLDAALLPERIASADIGVVPNRSNVFTDGILPTKLLEYVAMGVPVIVSETPGISAYFDPSMVRFVAPGDPRSLADAIIELAGDRDRRAALVAAADVFGKRFTWEDHSLEYIEMIGRLIDPAAFDEGSPV
jgi:glycosyltransferase involved in cell wall biosynthesis